MNNHPKKFMVWQNMDKDKGVTPNMIVSWAIEHFQKKYQEQVTLVAHHKTVVVDGHPSLSFEVDETIFSKDTFYIYGVTNLSTTGATE